MLKSLALTLLLLAAGAQAAPLYNVVDISELAPELGAAGVSAQALYLNQAGMALGSFVGSTTAGVFTWSRTGGFKVLDSSTGGGVLATPVALNARGTSVLVQTRFNASQSKGFSTTLAIRANGERVAIAGFAANAINDGDLIAGVVANGTSVAYGGVYALEGRRFVRTFGSGGFGVLKAVINNQGVVAATVQVAPMELDGTGIGPHWTNVMVLDAGGRVQTLAPASSATAWSEAIAINNAGNVLGVNWTLAQVANAGFMVPVEQENVGVWAPDGGFTATGAGGSSTCWCLVTGAPIAFNDLNEVVVGFDSFMYAQGQGFDLTTLINPQDAHFAAFQAGTLSLSVPDQRPGWSSAVNDAGVIASRAWNSTRGAFDAILLVPVK